MLADEQHAIHFKPPGAQRQGLLNTVAEPYAMLSGDGMAEVVVRMLLNVQARYAIVRKVMLAIPKVAVEEPAAEVISMRKVVVGGSYDREAARSRMRAAWRLGARARWHGE